MSQCEKVVAYIKKHGSITSWQAFEDLGITRLSGRIHDLTQKGYDFNRESITTKNRDGEPVTYTKYSFKAKEREDKKDEH